MFTRSSSPAFLFASLGIALAACATSAPEAASSADSELQTRFAGVYRAEPSTTNFDRNDATLTWDFYDLVITELGGGRCTYAGSVADIDCGTPCSFDDMDDPANRRVFEGACTMDGAHLTLLSTDPGRYLGDGGAVYKLRRSGDGVRLERGAHAQKLVLSSEPRPRPTPRDFVIASSVDYAKGGPDNNYVEFFELWPGDHTSPRPELVKAEVSSRSDVERALAECVFMKEGALGPHIDAATQARFSSRLAGELFSSKSPSTKFFRETGVSIGNGVFETPCVFAIEDGGHSLEVRGASDD